MKKNFLSVVLLISLILMLKILLEGINKEGPAIETDHIENKPPMGDKTVIVEVGPPHVDYPDIKVEPTADLEEDPDYGGIPIVIKGNGNNGS